MKRSKWASVHLAAALTLGVEASTISLASTAGAAAPPSKANYDTKVNALCSPYVDEFDAAVELVVTADGGRTAASHAAASLAKSLPKLQRELKKMEAVPKPTGQGTALSNAFKQAGKQLTQIGTLPAALKAGRTKKVDSILLDLDRSIATADEQFAALGLSACGRDVTSTTSPASTGGSTGTRSSGTATGYGTTITAQPGPTLTPTTGPTPAAGTHCKTLPTTLRSKAC